MQFNVESLNHWIRFYLILIYVCWYILYLLKQNCQEKRGTFIWLVYWNVLLIFDLAYVCICIPKTICWLFFRKSAGNNIPRKSNSVPIYRHPFFFRHKPHVSAYCIYEYHIDLDQCVSFIKYSNMYTVYMVLWQIELHNTKSYSNLEWKI